ncbi:hypothetical protein LOD99_14362 [Oopsacas minuta]|uniref:Uncharacterized protein n=1 Tax=Oopsacas minuta TaxID=111878 RepID=A0AAV7KF25_9METZ|nr:hypothetical protein LOD99_14362 [Oopsacas minuta]
MSSEMKESGEKRMHVEIIKFRAKNEGSNDPSLECDTLANEPIECISQDQKMQNHNGEIVTNSQIQNSLANKELKLSNGINGKEKEIIHNGNHIISNSKIVKPKEYKFFNNKGRWICKDTKEIKNEGREHGNDVKTSQPVCGKSVNSHPSPVVMVPSQVPDPLDELNCKPGPHPSPSPLPEQPIPVHASKVNNLVINHAVNSAVLPIENKINSIFKDSWDIYKQGVVQSLQFMFQQETQSLNDRIRNLIGLLTELQNENISLRSELEKYRQKHPPH